MTRRHKSNIIKTHTVGIFEIRVIRHSIENYRVVLWNTSTQETIEVDAEIGPAHSGIALVSAVVAAETVRQVIRAYGLAL